MLDCRALLIPSPKPAKAAKPIKAALAAKHEPNYFFEGCESGCYVPSP